VRVTLEGADFDERTAYMLLEVRHRLDGIPFTWSQGSYSTSVGASGGTHSGGGAVDIRLAGLEQYATLYETTMRSVGFAAWHRTAIPGVWPEHVHAIAIGCPDMSAAAAAQIDDYRRGLNGLAGHGPDTGSRDYVNVTWETYDPPAESIARAVWGRDRVGA
jgi:hypothetical protein